jgi:hypothetical protein
MVAPGQQRLAVALVESQTLVKPMSEAWEEPALVMPGADGMSQGAANIEVDGAGPQLGDDDGGLFLELLRQGVGIDVLGGAAPGITAPAPKSLGTTSSGFLGLPLLGSPSLPSPPIDWRQMGDEVEFTCL